MTYDGTKWVPQAPSGGSGSAHIIEDPSGTDMTARGPLQFVGATVTDDSVNDRTLVTISGGSSDTPWLQQIIPTVGPPTSTAGGAWSNVVAAGVLTGGWFQSSGALNDEAVWNVMVAPGTWRLDVTYYRDTNRGIETWALDDGAGTYTTLGTLDQYGGGATNLVHSLTGLVVGGSAVNRKLRVKAASKNASSSAYYILIQSIHLLRTA